jgi:hypothetical protein
MNHTGPPARGARDPGGVLVPVLPASDGPPDAVAVAAWHLALSDLVGVDVPHDLLGMWLFPAQGGVVLLAPAELARDDVAVPVPTPLLHQHDLYDLEERVRRAGYRSAIAVPVRGPHRDVGLALFAALEAGRFGITQAMRLHAVVHALVPTFEALSVTPPIPLAAAGPETASPSLPEAVARAAGEARTGPELLRVLSGTLQPIVPHERLDIAVLGSSPNCWALLSGAPSGARWGEASDAVSDAVAALVEHRDSEGVTQIADLRRDEIAWPTYSPSRLAHRVRTALGVELRMPDGELAWLFLGGAAPHMFRPADREALLQVAPIVALRVHGLRHSLATEVGQAQLHALQARQPRAARLVTALATTAHWGEASRQFEREVCDALGFRAVRFALRLGEDRVVMLAPGELRPLGELPAERLELSPLGSLLRGAARFLVSGEGDGDLAVPLRIAGRPVGALELLGGAPENVGRAVTTAQQFADVVAPHLELIRRAALSGRMDRAPIALPTRPGFGS